MKKLWIFTVMMLGLSAWAGTNVLQLTWLEPPGYHSTLYCATNLGSGWTSLGVVQPPFNVCPTGQMAYFYVNVAPAVPENYAGGGEPWIDAMPGSYYVNTNTGDWWVDVGGGTNGWEWYIAGF